MQCWQCGAKVRPEAKLCVYCGANLVGDAESGDANKRRRSGSATRSGRDAGAGRSRRDDEMYQPSSGNARHPYDDDQNLRDIPERGASREQGYYDPDYSSDDTYRPGGRADRDPQPAPRAPQGGRSLSVRDANARRASEDRESRRGADRRGSDRSLDRRDNGARADDVDDAERWDPRDRQAGDRGADRGRGGRGAAYPPEPSDEYPAQGWRDESAEYDRFEQYDRDGRYDRDDRFAEAPGGVWQDDEPNRSRRSRYAGPPLDDSWGMPAASRWADDSVGIPVTPARQSGGKGRGSKAAGQSEKSADKRRPLRTIIGAIIVVAVLSTAGAFLAPTVLSRLNGSSSNTCAAGGSSASLAAPATPANYKVYTDKQTGYTLPYPSSWSVTTATDTSQAQADDVTRFTQSSSNAVFSVEHAPSFDCATNTEIINTEELGGQQAGETFTEIPSGGGAQTVSGEQCLRKAYTVTTQSKLSLRMSIIACHHGGKGYAFVVYSDVTAFDQINTSDFQTMLTDFRFGK